MRFPEKIQIGALVANRSADILREQMAQTGCKHSALFDEAIASQHDLPGGMSAAIDIVTDPSIDMVVVAVAGVIGLLPTTSAISAGKDIALASKEVLVAAGEVVMPLIEECRVNLTPIDSEHSAIFQCLQGAPEKSVRKLTITASGGPFRGKRVDELQSVSREQALNHPTWSMGGKITIDSATLMNKGLEIIEARWLFGVPHEQIDVVIHPQSIIHSFVEFADGSVLAQLGIPDMRIPIQYALLWPERLDGGLPPWSPLPKANLTFESADHTTFPSIGLALEAAKAGGTMPCVLNAANEEAANGFLAGKVSFLGIADVVRDVMNLHDPLPAQMSTVLETDSWARAKAQEAMSALLRP